MNKNFFIDYFDTIKIIEEYVKPIKRVIEIPVEKSYGYINAEDLYNDIDFPSFKKSNRDGFAVNSEKIKINKFYEFAEPIFAGDNIDENQTENLVYKIMTGAPVPKNCDSVIMVEDCEIKNNKVKFLKKINKYDNISLKGEYLKKNSCILNKNQKINSNAVSLIVSAGYTKIKVYDKPEISLIVSGDEIVDPRSIPKKFQIRDSNTLSIKTLLNKYNLKLINSIILRDNEQETFNKIKQELNKTDLLIISGGVSMGDKDYVHKTIKQICDKILFYKIKMKPGKPVILGELNNKYVLGLPGNPLSVITSFEVVGIPVIKKIMNYKQCCRKWFNVKTNSDIYKTDKRLLFLNGKIVYKNNEPEFIPKHFKTSADLINSGESDGLGLIEKNVIKKDEYIKFISLNIL